MKRWSKILTCIIWDSKLESKRANLQWWRILLYYYNFIRTPLYWLYNLTHLELSTNIDILNVLAVQCKGKSCHIHIIILMQRTFHLFFFSFTFDEIEYVGQAIYVPCVQIFKIHWHLRSLTQLSIHVETSLDYEISCLFHWS